MNGKTSSVFQRLLAATLLVSGLGALAAPAFADGTAAGTSIENTATATYDNPDNASTPLKSTSNTVKVTVAEVAGITVTPLSTIDVNGGKVSSGDVVNYEFKVTNVGNDTTGFYIPGIPVVTGPGTATTVQIVAYIAPDGTRTPITPTTPITIVASGQNTTALSGLPSILGAPAGVIPPGYSLVLNIPTTITATASSGSDVVVRIGDTGSNDNGVTTQNVDLKTGDKTYRIYTVDYTGSYSGEALGSPAVEKEGSATQTVKVDSTSQALATILKTRTSYDPKDVTTLTDDVIGYGLELKVESAAPDGSGEITLGKLVGTNIKVDGPTVNRVLISDAVPVLTKLTNVGDVITPKNWIPVYTADPLTTSSAIGATWSTTFNANATRIGFIYDATTTPLSQGSNITGFGFKVVTSGVTGTAPVNILNIAQVFGQTQGNVGPKAPLVYDESGDKNPSNFNDDGNPGSTATLTPSSSTIPSGSPNEINDGIDKNNNNTGSGPGGEDNVTTIALAGPILNGPNGLPGAIGPNNNNDDFTNRSAPIPIGTAPGATIDPNPVTFTNTISNPGTASLTNVLVVPDAVTFVATAGDQLPPTGTTVTLTYGNLAPAVYTFNGTNFILISANPIIIPSLDPSQPVSYSVTVDLPANTQLSTDTGKGFSVPIYAFVDKNGDSRPNTDGTEPTQNRTIDRVYTGFLQMVKEARILDKDGAPLTSWTKVSSDLTGKAAKGRFIEYRITYKNISIAPTGAGKDNLTLDANKIIITEDGANGGNSWAKDTDNNGVIDTSHSIGSVSVTYGGPSSVIYSPSGEQTGTTAATDVTKYVHQPGVIIRPQTSGTFIFRRKIN